MDGTSRKLWPYDRARFSALLGWAPAYRGQSLIALGQAQEGLALLTQGLAALRATGTVVSMPMLFTWLAEAHAMLGQSAEEQHSSPRLRRSSRPPRSGSTKPSCIGCGAIC